METDSVCCASWFDHLHLDQAPWPVISAGRARKSLRPVVTKNMTLQLQMRDKMKEAMKAKNAVRLSVVRGIIAAFTTECVAIGRGPAGELTDAEAIAVIRKEAKKRKDSIEQFTAGGRPELAENEQAELAILNEFLPAQMGEEEIKKLVEAKIDELGLDRRTLRETQGKLMKAIMQDLKGKADGGLVKRAVENTLI